MSFLSNMHQTMAFQYLIRRTGCRPISCRLVTFQPGQDLPCPPTLMLVFTSEDLCDDLRRCRPGHPDRGPQPLLQTVIGIQFISSDPLIKRLATDTI